MDKVKDEVVRLAATTAIEIYKKEQKREQRQRTDRRLHDTKKLMRNYCEIRLHASDAIASLSDVQDEDFDFFKDLMAERDHISVESIIVSRAKSAIMLNHIDAMLWNYRTICVTSCREEDARRYRVLEALCLIDDPPTVQVLAQRENVDMRTIYRDFDAACEKMSALLFGIQWLEHEH